MRYFSLTRQDKNKILELCGVTSFEQLTQQIPNDLRLKRPLNVPPPADENSLMNEMQTLAQMNSGAQMACFLGQGVYDHSSPAVIDQICNRGEFLTAYTPYQPELAQGTLQTIFEFQSLISELTQMEVSNASLYDGSTALVEAILMAARLKNQANGRVWISEGVYPRTIEVLKTYLDPLGFELEIWKSDSNTFTSTSATFPSSATPPIAIVLQSPNRWGVVENWNELQHSAQPIRIAYVSHPISLARYQSPGASGVDIVASEGQSLGIPMGFGGPYLGLFSCRKAAVRQMPGRLVGLTQDTEGRRAFCVTLSTREQHIRRDKATSNICSNQNLMALRAGIYLSLMGPQGLERVFDLCWERAQYAVDQLQSVPDLKLVSGPRFNEVGILIPRNKSDLVQRIQMRSEAAQMLAGIEVPTPQADLKNKSALMLAFTEKHRFEDIDRLIAIIREEFT